MSWSVEKSETSLATIKIKGTKGKDWEQWGLLSSDRHIDNPKTKLVMQKRHLDLARERNAFVIDTGDFFCAMQGKFDPRSYKPDLNPENRDGDYLGSLVKTGYKFWAPYRDLLAILAHGNHETAIKKRCEFDLTNALVEKLVDKGSNVVHCGYRGWVKFQFFNGNQRGSLNLYYTHGGGGGGEVTKGVIKAPRRAVYLPDAHIVIGGHIHEAWQLELPRIRLLTSGREINEIQTHVSLPTYKEEFVNVTGGYHHEKERPPKPLGAWWIRFFYNADTEKVDYELTRAK